MFVLRFILHDWPDASCVKILKNLRAAATLATRLVVLDAIMPHVCHVPGGPPPPPAPLLGNLGAGLGGTLTMLDIQVPCFSPFACAQRGVTRRPADAHALWW